MMSKRSNRRHLGTADLGCARAAAAPRARVQAVARPGPRAKTQRHSGALYLYSPSADFTGDHEERAGFGLVLVAGGGEREHVRWETCRVSASDQYPREIIHVVPSGDHLCVGNSRCASAITVHLLGVPVVVADGPVQASSKFLASATMCWYTGMRYWRSITNLGIGFSLVGSCNTPIPTGFCRQGYGAAGFEGFQLEIGELFLAVGLVGHVTDQVLLGAGDAKQVGELLLFKRKTLPGWRLQADRRRHAM